MAAEASMGPGLSERKIQRATSLLPTGTGLGRSLAGGWMALASPRSSPPPWKAGQSAVGRVAGRAGAPGAAAGDVGGGTAATDNGSRAVTATPIAPARTVAAIKPR